MQEVVEEWAEALLWSYRDYAPERIPDVVRSNRSVLRPGAAPDDIRRTEDRLGVSLPPSYREFLSLTDGAFGARWPEIGRSIEHPALLLPVDHLAWARNHDWEWTTYMLDVEGDPALDMGRGLADRSGREVHHEIHHEEARYLGGSADPLDTKIGQAIYWLTVGDWGQEGLLVLNPLVADAAGESEVVELHHFGLQRFPSFRAWLESARDQVVDASPVGDGDPLPPAVAPRIAVPPSQPPAVDTDPTQRGFAEAIAARNALRVEVESCLADGDFETAAEIVRTRVTADTADMIRLLARHDDPAVWRTLESLTTEPAPVGWMALLEAANTSAPFVVDLAASGVDGGEFDNAFRRTALEMQQTTEAADRLFDLASQGNLWALRALARRRDSRALLRGLGLLGSADRDEKLTGAEVLRDLRHPDSVAPLTNELDAPAHPEVAITVAHALAMMQAVEVAPRLRQIRGLDADGEALTNLWADQLDELAGASDADP